MMCKWLSDWFSYICCNADCHRCADTCDYDLANMPECKHFEEREEDTDGDGCRGVYQGKEEDV